MHNRNKSIYSIIDATPGQHDYPLSLWGLASVELWAKNEKEDNKYKEIELYHFVNYFQVDAFKINFFKEFEIYKKEYPDGTIETFRKKEYQQFIYECGDMIEMFDKEDYYYWTTVRGLDFYLQQIDFYKKAYVLTKAPHSHEINLRALLQFLEVDYINDYQDKKNVNLSENIEKPKLTIKQIALIYAYENILITRENQNKIAKEHKHNTGGRLYQDFLFFYEKNNRKAKPFPSYTRKTLNNKIKLFESIIELLKEETKKKAKDELTILKGFLLDFE